MSIQIDEETKQQLRISFAKLVTPVKLVFFTQRNSCPACEQQGKLLEEVASLSDNITLQVFDFVLHGDQIRNYRITKIPATAVVGEKDYGIRFYGVTAGYEFTSLLETIVMVSAGTSGLDPQLEAVVRSIKEPVHLQVMVTLTCPFCPRMVHVANQLALVNENIRSDMVESSEYPHLVQRYNVTGVPKTIINETHSFEGAISADAAYVEILKAVNPEEYRRLEETIREARGVRNVSNVEESHEYDILIVGGGPAAMSAVIYAARKGLDVALIAKKLGGQMEYTATIDNYLGLPDVPGAEMTELFRLHVEKYPISEALGETVAKVEKGNGGFLVFTDDAKRYVARSVIYCAGMEYRRLGVPGEDRFIGRGIGFCATCDAPLYRDKRVAVVGGGNSAFTSARDLMNFASEIHIIHRGGEFSADETLVQEVKSSEKVVFHTSMIVKSFLGWEKLSGVRLESADGADRYDVPVDGVFLEIGLIPNSGPVLDLVDLNEAGEIPVDRDQATSVEGLYAAGDVTEVEEKQISIAVGQGATAALAAYKYLMRRA